METIVRPEEVAERHYFLESLYHTHAIWEIRIALIIIAIAAVMIYIKYSRKK